MRIVYGLAAVAVGVALIRYRIRIAKWQVREQNRFWRRFGFPGMGSRAERASAATNVTTGLVLIIVSGLIVLGVIPTEPH